MHPFGIPLLPHVASVGSPLFTQLNWKLILRFTIYSFNTILHFFKKLQVEAKPSYSKLGDKCTLFWWDSCRKEGSGEEPGGKWRQRKTPGEWWSNLYPTTTGTMWSCLTPKIRAGGGEAPEMFAEKPYEKVRLVWIILTTGQYLFQWSKVEKSGIKDAGVNTGWYPR